MYRIITYAVILLIAAGSLQAQTTAPKTPSTPLQRSVSASNSIEDFRPVGELRIWTFFAKQKAFGKLKSVVKETTDIDGRSAVVFEDELSIDYSQFGSDRKVAISGEQYASSEGAYLGTSYKIGPADSTESLELRLEDKTVEGYYTRGDNEIETSVDFAGDMFAWDADFVDQLEVMLAMRDIAVGDSIIDSVFLPQSLVKSRVVGTVASWEWNQIYKGRWDSVFVINLTSPQRYQLCFAADKRLIKTNMLDQDRRVYLDLVQKPKPDAVSQQSRSFSAAKLLLALPHYLAYLLVGAAVVMFLAAAGRGWLNSYLALVVGGALFALVPLVQSPIQQWIAETWMLPAMKEGGSLYGLWLAPSLVAGVLQEGLKLGALVLILMARGEKGYRFAAVGAFLGAGFGIVESCYALGFTTTQLFTWSLLERTFLIIFHAGSGALLGYALDRGKNCLPIFVTVTVALNTVLRYSPLFVREQVIDGGLMHFIQAFLIVGFLLLVIFVLKKKASQEEPAQRVRL